MTQGESEKYELRSMKEGDACSAARSSSPSTKRGVLQVEEQLLVDLLTDPVMAAKVLMGWELDDFQAAALRMDWWYPNTIDSSGVSTGKTLRIFILVCLRCMLIPDHVAAVYFQNFQMGK